MENSEKEKADVTNDKPSDEGLANAMLPKSDGFKPFPKAAGDKKKSSDYADEDALHNFNDSGYNRLGPKVDYSSIDDEEDRNELQRNLNASGYNRSGPQVDYSSIEEEEEPSGGGKVNQTTNEKRKLRGDVDSGGDVKSKGETPGMQYKPGQPDPNILGEHANNIADDKKPDSGGISPYGLSLVEDDPNATLGDSDQGEGVGNSDKNEEEDEEEEDDDEQGTKPEDNLNESGYLRTGPKVNYDGVEKDYDGEQHFNVSGFRRLAPPVDYNSIKEEDEDSIEEGEPDNSGNNDEDHEYWQKQDGYNLDLQGGTNSEDEDDGNDGSENEDKENSEDEQDEDDGSEDEENSDDEEDEDEDEDESNEEQTVKTEKKAPKLSEKIRNAAIKFTDFVVLWKMIESKPVASGIVRSINSAVREGLGTASAGFSYAITLIKWKYPTRPLTALLELADNPMGDIFFSPQQLVVKVVNLPPIKNLIVKAVEIIEKQPGGGAMPQLA